MDIITATKRLARLTECAVREDRDARKRLADALAIDGAQLAGLMDAALVTAANAKPWADLAKRIERHGVRDGLAKMREEAMEALLQYGFSMSTSLVTNAARMAEQDGLRRFLNRTETIEIDAEESPAPAESA